MITQFTKILTYSCTLIIIYLQRGDRRPSLKGQGYADNNSLQWQSTLTQQRCLALILRFPMAPGAREE